MKRTSIIIAALWAAISINATTYSAEECQGSLGPYPAKVELIAHPDSLTPIFMNHLGRHGSRYPASAYSATTMRKALLKADSLKTITPLGKRFLKVINSVIARSNGQWGQLDSTGMAEHRGIADRMTANFPTLFNGGNILAGSSKSPRAIMSMYSFTHELSLKAKDITIGTISGKELDETLRPFDVSDKYRLYAKEKPWKATYDHYVDSLCPNTVTRLLGKSYPATTAELKQLSIIEYYNIANLKAMGMANAYSPYLSITEYNRLWSCFNLRQYYQHTQSAISTTPADIAAPLLDDIVYWCDKAADSTSKATAVLRFAHAETVMPLVSLMRLPHCWYTGNDVANLKDNWKDFEVVPMAANLQVVIYKASGSGRVYAAVYLNEKAVAPIEGDAREYVPWNTLREYWNRLIGDGQQALTGGKR